MASQALISTGHTIYIAMKTMRYLSRKFSFKFDFKFSRKFNNAGMTMQTLIVTTALVGAATAGGVAILGVSGGSSDSVEQQGGALEPSEQCNEVEVYDSSVASLGTPGTNGNAIDGQRFQGSANGCKPVCVWFDQYGNEEVYSGEVSVNRALTINTDNPGRMWLFKTPTEVFNPYTYGSTITINPSDSELQGAKFLPTVVKVKLDDDEQDCSGYDAQGNAVSLTPYQARQQGLYSD